MSLCCYRNRAVYVDQGGVCIPLPSAVEHPEGAPQTLWTAW